MENDNLQYDKKCELCGLAVEVKGFELTTLEGVLPFCCEGCKGIYRMLHEDKVLPETVDKAGNK